MSPKPHLNLTSRHQTFALCRNNPWPAFCSSDNQLQVTSLTGHRRDCIVHDAPSFFTPRHLVYTHLPITMAVSVTTSLSYPETITLTTLSGVGLAILANTLRGNGEPLIASLALSILGFALCYSMIRWLGPTFMRAGFRGRDMSKLQRTEIPECMGAVCAAVYLLTVIVFIPFPFYKDIVAATSGGGNRDVVVELESQNINQGRLLHRFPHNKVRKNLVEQNVL